MRKLLFVSAALLMAASMSSCKKNYTCSCSTSGVPVTSYTIDATKSSATTTCNNYATSLSTATGSTVTCSIQ